jgi:hypothetical protein
MPATTCTLINTSSQMRTLNLPHAVVPEAATMRVVAGRDHNPKTGEKTFRPVKRPISGSITFMPKGKKGDTVSGVPRTVLRLPEVQALLQSKALVLRDDPAEVPAQAPAPATDAPTGAGTAPATGQPQEGAPTGDAGAAAEVSPDAQAAKGDKQTPGPAPKPRARDKE